jgi:hypothetical protein
MEGGNRKTSLRSQSSSGTSESGVHAESTTTISERLPPNLRHAASFGHPPSWSGSITLPSSFSAIPNKENLATEATDPTKRPFMSLLFDRDDYLRSTSEDNNENDMDGEVGATAHSHLVSQGFAVDNVTVSGSRSNVPQSQTRSSRAEQYRQSIKVTHLTGRQQTGRGIRTHPNLNLRDIFGNMPFSSSIRTNNYPPEMQDMQVKILFLPTWAMMTANTRPDPGSLRSAFVDVQKEATALLNSGAPINSVLERHPNLAALWDENEFNRSGILSRWAAGMVHSVRLKGKLVVRPPRWLLHMRRAFTTQIDAY